MISARSEARDQFAIQFPKCWVCGKHAHDTHEIVRGAMRHLGYIHRSCWIRTCRRCHDQELGDLSRWPVARQLALKKQYDPEYYNRIEVNLLRRRQPDSITESEVDYYANDRSPQNAKDPPGGSPQH